MMKSIGLKTISEIRTGFINWEDFGDQSDSKEIVILSILLIFSFEFNY